MPNSVECPRCKRWYESNKQNICPFCGFIATVYDHVKVEASVTGSARAYVEVVTESLLHPKVVTVIERGTGSLVGRFTPEQFASERAKYPPNLYIIV